MQQLGEKPIISTAVKTTAPTPAAAPWLQPVKTSSSTQPWMPKQSVGAPGTSSAAAGAPGVQAPVTALGTTPATAYPPPTPSALGATPATAYPPPTASTLGATPETAYPPPTAATYAGYAQQSWGTGAEQQQEWTQADYNAYYAQWGQAAAGTAGAEYQYAQYGAAATAATGAAIDPATGYPATTAAATATAATDYQYQQYQQYSSGTNPPQ
jgi:hypothetical protein